MRPRSQIAAAGAQHVTLARSERRHLVERLVPVAARRPVRRSCVFRQIQREAADQPAVGAVQLDRRRQAVGCQIGVRPDDERAVGGRRWCRRRRTATSSASDGIASICSSGVLQARSADPRAGSRPAGRSRRDQPFLGLGREREQRRVHRQRRHEQREEEDGEPRGLRDAPHPAVDARQRQRARLRPRAAPRRSAPAERRGRRSRRRPPR